MKTQIILAISACVLLTGCVHSDYGRTITETTGEGTNTVTRVTQVHHKYNSFGLNRKAVKVALDSQTKTTHKGVTIGEIESVGDSESLGEFTNLIREINALRSPIPLPR